MEPRLFRLYDAEVNAVLCNWKVVLLALLIAWSGFSYGYHTARSAPDHDSPAMLAQELADHSGKLEKNCDHCCHGGSHTLALCSEALAYAALREQTFAIEPVVAPRTYASPPITPPPQA